jgi:hypothetical protein
MPEDSFQLENSPLHMEELKSNHPLNFNDNNQEKLEMSQKIFLLQKEIE